MIVGAGFKTASIRKTNISIHLKFHQMPMFLNKSCIFAKVFNEIGLAASYFHF